MKDDVTLGQFFTELAENDDLLEDFLENRERAMAEYGLSPAKRDIILNCELAAIRDAIHEELGSVQMVLIVHGGGTVQLPPPPPPPPPPSGDK